MLRYAGVVAIALSLSLAAGCQAPMSLHQMKQPMFALGQAGEVMPVGIEAQATSARGQLLVRFDSALGKLVKGRRIQATFADVDKIEVTVKPTGAAEVTQTVLKAALTNGQASVTFSGLPLGAAKVTITAFDASGANIGSTSQSATVTAGQVATLHVGLQLSPSYVPGNQGGGGNASGGLAAGIQLQDGITITASGSDIPTLVGSYNHEMWGTALAIDAQGNAWMGAASDNEDPFGSPLASLVKFSPSGEMLVDLTLPGSVMDVAIDPQGHVWAATELNSLAAEHLMRFSPDGVVVDRFDVVSGMKAIAMDVAGWPWISHHGTPQRFKPGQSAPFATIPNYGDSMAVDLSVDSHGHLWLVNHQFVECYQPDGTKLKSLAVHHSMMPEEAFGSSGIAVDINDDVWAIDGAKVLRKFSHEGALLGEWPGFGQSGLLTLGVSSQRLMPDPRGGIWVRSERALTRLDTNGQVVTTLSFSADRPAGGLAISATDLWMTYGGQLHHFTF